MTPAEHYTEAERLLGTISGLPNVPTAGPAAQIIVAIAQVHATLAMVPAQAVLYPRPGPR